MQVVDQLHTITEPSKHTLSKVSIQHDRPRGSKETASTSRQYRLPRSSLWCTPLAKQFSSWLGRLVLVVHHGQTTLAATCTKTPKSAGIWAPTETVRLSQQLFKISKQLAEVSGVLADSGLKRKRHIQDMRFTTGASTHQ